jgi:nucleotidyltransferase substrate binding protein (TIGR01987 family)
MKKIDKDIRWLQRLDNFQKAFLSLKEAMELSMTRDLSDIEKEGFIQRFEYNWELSWKTIKEFYKYLGDSSIQGSRDAFLMAYKNGLIKSEEHGQYFMNSIKSRNDTVHGYNKETANEIFCAIRDKYYKAFEELLKSLLREKKSRNL